VGNPEDTSKENEVVSDSDAAPSLLENIEDPPVTKKGKNVIRQGIRKGMEKAGSPDIFAVITPAKVKTEPVEAAIPAEAGELEDTAGM
jgi:hypothetical protein